MITFGSLNRFDSFINRLQKGSGLYQPRDLHLCIWCDVLESVKVTVACFTLSIFKQLHNSTIQSNN